eukprot:COSAG02_NODE_2101_length_9808_cov_3.575658_6_plen_144_part_00
MANGGDRAGCYRLCGVGRWAVVATNSMQARDRSELSVSFGLILRVDPGSTSTVPGRCERKCWLLACRSHRPHQLRLLEAATSIITQLFKVALVVIVICLTLFIFAIVGKLRVVDLRARTATSPCRCGCSDLILRVSSQVELLF